MPFPQHRHICVKTVVGDKRGRAACRILLQSLHLCQSNFMEMIIILLQRWGEIWSPPFWGYYRIWNRGVWLKCMLGESTIVNLVPFSDIGHAVSVFTHCGAVTFTIVIMLYRQVRFVDESVCAVYELIVPEATCLFRLYCYCSTGLQKGKNLPLKGWGIRNMDSVIVFNYSHCLFLVMPVVEMSVGLFVV